MPSFLPAGFLTWTILVGSVLAASLLLGAVAARALRVLLGGRRARAEREMRPMVLAVASGEDIPPELVAARGGLGRAAERIVFAYLARVRGESATFLAEVLSRRGAVTRLISQTQSPRVHTRARAAERLGLGDLGLALRIHQRLCDERQPYRVGFVPEPCCWTMVPHHYRRLARQRAQWSASFVRALWAHRPMLLRPGYGTVGLLVLPCYLVIELASAMVEVLAVAAAAGGLVLGLIGPWLMALFAVAGPGYGALLTVISVIAEELSYHRYRSWRDFALLVCAAVAESAGFRQADAWWRLRGLARAVLRRGANRAGEPDVRGPGAAPRSGCPRGNGRCECRDLAEEPARWGRASGGLTVSLDWTAAARCDRGVADGVGDARRGGPGDDGRGSGGGQGRSRRRRCPGRRRAGGRRPLDRIRAQRAGAVG